MPQKLLKIWVNFHIDQIILKGWAFEVFWLIALQEHYRKGPKLQKTLPRLKKNQISGVTVSGMFVGEKNRR